MYRNEIPLLRKAIQSLNFEGACNWMNHWKRSHLPGSWLAGASTVPTSKRLYQKRLQEEKNVYSFSVYEGMKTVYGWLGPPSKNVHLSGSIHSPSRPQCRGCFWGSGQLTREQAVTRDVLVIVDAPFFSLSCISINSNLEMFLLLWIVPDGTSYYYHIYRSKRRPLSFC